jgi:hypothetical protein
MGLCVGLDKLNPFFQNLSPLQLFMFHPLMFLFFKVTGLKGASAAKS